MKSLALLWLAAIPASLLVSRMGALRAVMLVLFVTAIGGAVRGLSPMQPALPAVVREWMPAQRITLGTATYSNGLLVGEAISTSLTIPAVTLHWRATTRNARPSLAHCAIVSWLQCSRMRPASRATSNRSTTG